MAKKAKAPNVAAILEETGEELTPEEQAAQEAEEAAAAAIPEDTGEEGEPKPAKEPEGQQQSKENRVPMPRFQQVEQERDRARQEAAELREKWARLEERKKVAEEATQRAQQAEEQAKIAAQRPDPELDPAGARAWDAEQRAIRAEQIANNLQQQVAAGQQQGQQTMADMQWQFAANNAIETARRVDPQHDAKVDALKGVFRGMWKAAGRSEQEADIIMAATERALIDSSLRSGVSLNQMVGAIAQDAQSFAQRLMELNGATNGNGNGVRKVTPEALPNASEKMRQIQNGQKAQGLGKTQSGETQARTPWQQMDPVEFANYIEAMDEDTFMEMTENPQYGKEFNQKVNALG